MGQYSFGYDYGMFNQWSDTAFEDFNAIMDCATSAPIWLLTSSIPETKCIPHYRKTRAVLNRIHAGFDQIIASKGYNFHGADILSQLLLKYQQHNYGPNAYTMKDVKDDMLSLFFAGHETTGNTITFVIYYLAKYPKWQPILRQEILKGLATKDTKIQDYSSNLWNLLRRTNTSDIQEKFPLLSAFIAEVMRLMPALPLSFSRTVAKDGVQLDGFPLEKGLSVRLDFRSANRGNYFGNEPNTFHPERFIQEGDILNKPLVGKLVNFSSGSHRCIGSTLAMLQIHMVIFQQYTLLLLKFL